MRENIIEMIIIYSIERLVIFSQIWFLISSVQFSHYSNNFIVPNTDNFAIDAPTKHIEHIYQTISKTLQTRSIHKKKQK